MTIYNTNQFREFCKELPNDTIFLRFTEMYDTMEKLCGSCRGSDHARAKLELIERYKHAARCGGKYYKEIMHRKNDEELAFYNDLEFICEYSSHSTP